MDYIYIVLFGFCFSLHVTRSVYSFLNSREKINPKNKFLNVLMYIVMFVLWLAWFQMCEIDPAQIPLPEYIQILGLILFILGILLFIIPVFQLRGLENIDHLVTNGIFAVIRLPMYLGMIFWVIGYSLFLGSKYTLLSSVLWIANILYWRYLEEKELLEKYSEYLSYKKKTVF